VFRAIAGAAILVGVLAAWTTVEAQPSASIDRLKALLVDSAQSDRARLRAADQLGALDDPRAVRALVESLSDSREIVRFGAARALGRPGRSAAVEPLVSLVATPAESRSVRAAAASSLGAIGDARALTALMAARADGAPEVRVAARQSLLMLPPGQAPLSRLDLLSEIVADRDAAEAPRAQAARMLGEGADPRALPLLLASLRAPAATPRVVASLGDFVEVRAAAKASLPAAAARALAAYPAREVVPALAQAAPEAAGEGKIAIVETLARLRARDAMPVFVAALADPEPRARRWAAFILADIAERDVLDRLRAAVHDPDEGVRLYATRALMRLGDFDAVETLVEALRREPAAQVRDAMTDALAVLAPVSPW
jgi:HEAT repeat protein